MSCFALAHNDVRQAKGLQPLAAPAGLSPADLQSAYDLPSGTAGSGATPALVDAYDAPNAEADPAVYRSQFGLPPCTTDNGCFPRTDPGVFRSAEEQAPVPVRPVPRGRGSGLPASASALVESGRSERSDPSADTNRDPAVNTLLGGIRHMPSQRRTQAPCQRAAGRAR
ncbi:hypothetical protein [Streptomyces mirabilis]|uniref:hypothetical protein n=1 Tax=Streptomyces mirabilis TaxID=68239 RepID=UPI003673AD63